MSSCLLINTDASPVSMLPLSTLSWQEAIKYMVLDKAVVLEWYDDWIVRSQNWSTRVPAVLMLREYQPKKTSIRYSKSNVFLRDGYVCCYCEKPVTRKTATLDHIIPVSHGGKSTFENSCTACGPCNARKGNNASIRPNFKPYRPSYFQLVDKRKKLGWENLPHPSWINYIGSST